MLPILLDLLFPRRSITGEEGAWITESELLSLRCAPVILEAPLLQSHGLLYIDRLVASADYKQSPLLHRAIHMFKYKKARGAGEALGRILAEASVLCRTGKAEKEKPVLCPVPLHWIRKFSRGFNQSEILARAVAEARKWEVQHLLNRVKWTGSQVGRRRKTRLTAVRDAFRIRRGRGRVDTDKPGWNGMPSHVILIDDLSTTGATLDACAKELKAAGAESVEGLVIALG